MDRPVWPEVKTIDCQLLGVREPDGGDLEISDRFRHDASELFVTRLPFDIAYFGIFGKKNHVPWRPRIDARKLKRAHDELALRLLKVREELQTAERHRVGLEVLLNMRQERLDALTVQVEQLRRQNQKLDAEAEHLAAIIRSEGFILHANPQGRC